MRRLIPSGLALVAALTALAAGRPGVATGALLVGVLALQPLLLGRRLPSSPRRRTGPSRLRRAGTALVHGTRRGVVTAVRAVVRAGVRAAGAVTTAMMTALGALAFYLVLTPLGLGARLLGVSMLPSGEWRPHRSRTPEGRAHGGAPAPLQDRNSGRPSWRIALALVAVGALAATLVPRLADRGSESAEAPAQLRGESYNPFDAPALADADWKDEAGPEFSEASAGLTYTSYVGNSLRDYEGRYVNISDRQRRSYRTEVADGEPLEVWFFGGSTMFGFSAQRDLHTIPSEVVRLAEDDGLAVEARNFGAPGYVNMQATVLAAQLLAAGGRPDLIVFYDGINDFAVEVQKMFGGIGVPGDPSEIVAFAYRELLAGQLTGTNLPPTPLAPVATTSLPPRADDLVDAVAQVYRRGIDLARALGEAYDVPVAHFWQPDLFNKGDLVPGEQEVVERLDMDEFQFEAFTRISRALVARLPDGAVDLSGAFEGASEPILTDQAHTNELGARLVAEAMYAELQSTLALLPAPG